MARAGRRGSLVAVVTALALLATPLPALATFAVNIQGPGLDYGGAGITVVDNEPSGRDFNPAVGVIQLTSGLFTLPAIPGFSLNSETVFTNSPGGPSFSILDLTFSLSSSGDVGGTIQVTASGTDFTFPAAGVPSTLTSTISGNMNPAGGSVTAQQWATLSNELFGSPSGLGPITPGAQGPFTTVGFNNTATVGFTSATPYSITDRVNLTLGAGASMTGDLQSVVTPEPATMFLAGLGLLALGFAARRRLFGQLS